VGRSPGVLDASGAGVRVGSGSRVSVGGLVGFVGSGEGAVGLGVATVGSVAGVARVGSMVQVGSGSTVGDGGVAVGTVAFLSRSMVGGGGDGIDVRGGKVASRRRPLVLGAKAGSRQGGARTRGVWVGLGATSAVAVGEAVIFAAVGLGAVACEGAGGGREWRVSWLQAHRAARPKTAASPTQAQLSCLRAAPCSRVPTCRSTKGDLGPWPGPKGSAASRAPRRSPMPGGAGSSCSRLKRRAVSTKAARSPGSGPEAEPSPGTSRSASSRARPSERSTASFMPLPRPSDPMATRACEVRPARGAAGCARHSPNGPGSRPLRRRSGPR